MYFGVSQSRAREVVEKHREKNEGVRPFRSQKICQFLDTLLFSGQ